MDTIQILLLIGGYSGWVAFLYSIISKRNKSKSERPQLLLTLRNLAIHVWDEDRQALTSIEGYKTNNSGKEHKIFMAFYIVFDNMGKDNAKPIEAVLQWKNNHGNLLPKENLLEYHLRDMTFIKGEGKNRRWKYITNIMTPDINFHFIEASIKIIYKDSLDKKYCVVQLFNSSNGRIWNKGEYENFKIGIIKSKSSLKLDKEIVKN